MARYSPPTRVVTRQVPYLSLVTQADPYWARGKFREPQYRFEGRVIFFNPYFSGAYSSYSNDYAVGAQFGALDPAQVALAAINIGASASINAATLSLTAPAAIPAGSVILIVVADSAFAGGVIPGSSISDGGNQYQVLRSQRLGYPSGPPITLLYALTTVALGQGATITYTSPGAPSSNNAAAIAAVAITGGVQPTVFDPAVTVQTFGNSTTPSVTSGNPTQQKEVFVAFGGVALQATFLPDTADGWIGLQQATASGLGQVAVCTSVKAGGVFDPGSNATVTFAPTFGNTAANWSTMVVGVVCNKPMFQGVNDAKGWA